MVEVWIGNERADYDADIETQYSVADIRDLGSGNLNTSYDIDLPHTDNNIRLLKYINELSCNEEQNAITRIIENDIQIIAGRLIIVNVYRDYTKCVVSADDWIKPLESNQLVDLDLSTYSEEYNSTNVVASWTAAAGAFFRYPLIHFGLLDYKLGSWNASDFMPWFNVKAIFEKIFSGYTVSSTFLNASYFKSLYISSYWNKVDAEFTDNTIIDVKCRYTTDNQDSEVIAPSATVNLSLSKNIDLITSTNNPYGYWNINKYDVPMTGTHRIQCSIILQVDLNLMTQNSAEYLIILYKKPLVGADVVLQQVSRPVATMGTTETLDTGYIHLIAGEDVFVFVQATVQVYNPDSSSHTAKLYVTTDSTFKSIADDRCLLPGLGLTIDPADYMPRWTEAKFIYEIKKHFNLRLWLDSWNKTIYVEPQSTFNTDTIKSIANINYSEIETELISSNYKNNIYLQYIEDVDDIGLTDYNTINTTAKGQKKITLTSAFCEKGTEIIESAFSTFITGKPYSPNVTPIIPRIWGEYDKLNYREPQLRPAKFNVKIGTWNGLVDCGLNDWDYEGATKTTYPEILAIDFATIYATYFANSFHYIDKGKIITIEALSDPLFLLEFNTVVNDSANEGFRPTYQITYQNETHYAIINKVTSNGKLMKLELILKI